MNDSSSDDTRTYDDGPFSEIPQEKLHCSFCGKSHEQGEPLIVGSGKCAICKSCIEAMANTNSGHQELSASLCHFCGKTSEEVEHITPGPEEVNICNECIKLARQTIEADEALDTDWTYDGSLYDDADPCIETPPDLDCCFCGKGSEQGEPLIVGSDRCAICKSCIETMANTDSERQESSASLCHFCGKTSKEVEHITPGPEEVNICNECIKLAREIIEETTASAVE